METNVVYTYQNYYIDIKVNSRKEIKEAVDFAFKQDSQVRSYILKFWKVTDVDIKSSTFQK